MEAPYAGRATVNETMRGVSIEIPAKRNWLVIFVLCGWLAGWLMGEAFAFDFLYSALNSTDIEIFAVAFISFWLLAWTAGGLFVIRFLAWMWLGSELIVFEDNMLTLGRKIGPFSRKKVYDLREAKNFSFNPSETLTNKLGISIKQNTLKLEGGVFSFDYGLKTVAFGSGLDEAESRYLHGKIVSLGFFK